MKQKIFAIGLAAMLLAASSLGAAAIGVQPRMSLASAAQAKQVVRAKKLTDSQYEALRGELMQLFNFPELISGNVNRKEMTLAGGRRPGFDGAAEQNQGAGEGVRRRFKNQHR